MTTVLIEVNGQLESELRQAFVSYDLIPMTRADLELTNLVQVREPSPSTDRT